MIGSRKPPQNAGRKAVFPPPERAIVAGVATSNSDENRFVLDAILARRAELGSAAQVAREIGVSPAHVSAVIRQGKHAAGGQVLAWLLHRYFGGSHDAFVAAAPMGWHAWISRGVRRLPELAPAPTVSPRRRSTVPILTAVPPPVRDSVSSWARELSEVLEESGHDPAAVRDVIARLIIEHGQHHESAIRFATRAVDMLGALAISRESAVQSVSPAPKERVRKG
jgi:hypothetical protein